MVMTHDPLCPQSDPYSLDWEPDQRHWSCHCDLIKVVRDDQRRRDAAGELTRLAQDMGMIP